MESNANPEFRQAREREDEALAFLRNRQMSGKHVDEMIQSHLSWEWAMNAQSPRGVEFLIALGANLNGRTHRGRGFLLHGMDTSMPRWLLIHGLRKLNHAWWQPDSAGRTPFHHPSLDAVVAMALGQRAWSEGVEKEILAAGENPVALARWRNKPQVARTLAQWLRH